MKQSIFRAYDIRGTYPQEINETAAADIAAAFARYVGKKEKREKRKIRIVVGHDARLSSPHLYKAILKSLSSFRSSLSCIPAGLITTPMVTFLVNDLRADGGIMITASHNPKEYNGMKIVKRQGIPMSGEEIFRLLKKSKRTNN